MTLSAAQKAATVAEQYCKSPSHWAQSGTIRPWSLARQKGSGRPFLKPRPEDRLLLHWPSSSCKRIVSAAGSYLDELQIGPHMQSCQSLLHGEPILKRSITGLVQFQWKFAVAGSQTCLSSFKLIFKLSCPSNWLYASRGKPKYAVTTTWKTFMQRSWITM